MNHDVANARYFAVKEFKKELRKAIKNTRNLCPPSYIALVDVEKAIKKATKKVFS